MSGRRVAASGAGRCWPTSMPDGRHVLDRRHNRACATHADHWPPGPTPTRNIVRVQARTQAKAPTALQDSEGRIDNQMSATAREESSNDLRQAG
jgi:hypothetical protein